MKLPAPAKVNLHLRILGKRDDGFHDLETLMSPVSLADEITVEVSDGEAVELVCDDPAVPLGEENLAVRAAQVFSRHCGRSFSTRITLAKRIPMGAGLGGGSSDAAAVLRALDALLETHLPTGVLEEIASSLGSDVPFFIRGGAAWCRGRGEVIEPFTLPEKLPLLLLKPAFGVETPWAYRNWSTSPKLPDGLDAEQSLGWVRIFNSLERPVYEKFLILPVIKRWLLRCPEVRAAAMSGSGSTMFAILYDAASGKALEERAREEFGPGLWTALCQT